MSVENQGAAIPATAGKPSDMLLNAPSKLQESSPTQTLEISGIAARRSPVRVPDGGRVAHFTVPTAATHPARAPTGERLDRGVQAGQDRDRVDQDRRDPPPGGDAIMVHAFFHGRPRTGPQAQAIMRRPSSSIYRENRTRLQPDMPKCRSPRIDEPNSGSTGSARRENRKSLFSELLTVWPAA